MTKLRMLSLSLVFLVLSLPAKYVSGTGGEYWQQKVHYIMDVKLDTDEHVIRGTEQLVYHNNSPDTLHSLYFHLYQNAFQHGSYFDRTIRTRKRTWIQDLTPGEEAGTSIHSLTGPHGTQYDYRIDNTIMEVHLKSALMPGDSVQLQIGFATRFGEINRRMKREGNTYIAAHWYPRIAVYDAHRGWNDDQHLTQEFYGDFGTFELSLTLPTHFIVGATGVMQNREEMLPDSLRRKLALKNFSEKPWGEPPSEIIEPSDRTKTWHYLAKRVHDVAWVASPDFRIDEAEWKGIKIYALAKEQHATGWQDAASFTRELIREFSKQWGDYEYPKMIVSDVNSAMEYPMLTADGGRGPGYYGLLAHEVAHNWFYGMLGSNETYRAMMDEGFTNYIAAEAMRSILGPNNNTYWDRTHGWYAQLFFREYGRKYIRNDLRYMRIAKTGYLVDPLATHSSKFNEYRTYRQVYFKGATALYNLEYVLGDSLFREVIRTYVERWKFRHPYPEDFVNVAEELAGYDLNWFFDEWFYNASTVDYSIEGIENEPVGEDAFLNRVRLKRRDLISMPLDLYLEYDDGGAKTVRIPVNRRMGKPHAIDSLANPWMGWGDVNNRYTLELTDDARLTKVRIDTSGRLADINRLNNVSGGIPLNWHFDNMLRRMPSLDRYDIWLRPSLRYNGVDGLKPGVHWRSNYLPSEFLSWWDTEIGIWYGPLTQSFGYSLDFETPVKPLGRLTKAHAHSRVLEGRQWHSIGLSGTAREELYNRPFSRWNISLHHHRTITPDYVRHFRNSRGWKTGLQEFIEGGFTRGVEYMRGTGEYRIDLEASLFDSEFSYTNLSLKYHHTQNLFGKIPARFRIGGFLSTGAPPAQRALYVAGGNPASAVRYNWLYQSWGTLPPTWIDGNLTYGGGLNLRGYQQENVQFARGAAINVEFDLPSTGGIIPRKWLSLDWYLFGDAGGYMELSGNGDSDHWKTRADAGIGLKIPLRLIPGSLGEYMIRFDFPAWKNHPRPGAPAVDFRWVFALGRSW